MTMTISRAAMDALRAEVKRCWDIDDDNANTVGEWIGEILDRCTVVEPGTVVAHRYHYPKPSGAGGWLDGAPVSINPSDYYTIELAYSAPPAASEETQPRLTVRLVSFPESNGMQNWTALLVRAEPWDGLVGNCGGVVLDRGELRNRVAYSAEEARYLIGERSEEPDILAPEFSDPPTAASAEAQSIPQRVLNLLRIVAGKDEGADITVTFGPHDARIILSALTASTPALREVTEEDVLRCRCGRPYSLGPDLVIPVWAWDRISPKPNGGGVLCPNCIHDALVAEGLENVPAVFTSGPMAADPEPAK